MYKCLRRELYRLCVQVLILQLLNEATLAPRKSHKAADTTACFHRVLPVLLAIASAPDRAVRSAALDALQALAASVKASSSHAEGTLTGRLHCMPIGTRGLAANT